MVRKVYSTKPGPGAYCASVNAICISQIHHSIECKLLQPSELGTSAQNLFSPLGQIDYADVSRLPRGFWDRKITRGCFTDDFPQICLPGMHCRPLSASGWAQRSFLGLSSLTARPQAKQLPASWCIASLSAVWFSLAQAHQQRDRERIGLKVCAFGNNTFLAYAGKSILSQNHGKVKQINNTR